MTSWYVHDLEWAWEQSQQVSDIVDSYDSENWLRNPKNTLKTMRLSMR